MARGRLPKETMVFSATLLLSDAAASGATAPSPIAQFAPLIFIGVIFYFLLIRPQQKQRKEQQKLIEALKTGDKVITSAGIHGMISNVKERTVLLKVADNVKIEIDKAAVATVLEKSSEETAS
jgi:preprotein translocase subunit YajC